MSKAGVVKSSDGAATPRAANDLRPEIQGLRALAVGLVLAYHLWPERLPGGFIGVDVFFVISGFLIIGHLLREATATGRVRLGNFWLRRARRILPLALVVLTATAVATWVIAPVGLQSQFFEEVLAAVFFVENWRLAADSIDYLRADYEASPVQQYWSLGVEEQFYIALPLVIVGVLAVASVLKVGRIRAIGVTLVVLGLSSFVLSVVVTAQSPGVAYFGTHTRLWQFLLGGLLALVALARPSLVAVPRLAAHVLATAGAALIVGSAFFMSGDTEFPGWIALLPVIGVLAIIVSGPDAWFGRLSTMRVASVRPVLWAGDVSYGVYLWHWPIIIFAGLLLGPLSAPVKLAIAIGTLALATATKRYVEDPLRFGTWRWSPRAEPYAIAATALAAMLAVSGASAAGWANAERNLAALAEAERAPIDEPCLGAASLVETDRCDGVEFAQFYPSLDVLRSDDANNAECWSADAVDTIALCELGQREQPTLRAIAVGDSFNGALLEAYDIVGARNGWAIDVTSRRSCPWGLPPSEELWTAECGKWITLVDEVVAEGGYDLVITTASDRGATSARVASFSSTWGAVADSGMAVVAIDAPPRGVEDYLACVRSADRPLTQCTATEDVAYRFEGWMAPAADEVTGAVLVTMDDLVCASELCAPIVGGVYVYRDGGHLSRTYASTLAPYLADRLSEAFDAARRELDVTG